MWFVYSLICLLGWGAADLFYKRGSDGGDRDSHWKTAVWVGLVMGVCAVGLLPFSESGMSPAALIRNAVRYAPASVSYIISMVIGYAGLRHLELSIVSPVQNASGALAAIAMLIWFTASGQIGAFHEVFGVPDLIGTVLIVAGVIALAVTENRLARREWRRSGQTYRLGAAALLFPLLYCVFDTVGTAADGVILDGQNGLGLSEIDVLILYGLTFFAAGAAAWLYLLIRRKTPYNPFAKTERPKAAAAVCEEFGQIFYVFAMAQNPVLAAPMVASYCIVSVIFSRIFLKEKLTAAQYFCILPVLLGIVCLGISEGLAAG